MSDDARKQDAAGAEGDAGTSGKHALVLTMGRVKAMIKEDVEVKSISTEACFAVAKATEELLEAMAGRAGQDMLNAGRSSLIYNDVAKTVASWRSLDFLDELIPQKVSAATVLARMAAQPEDPAADAVTAAGE